MFFYGKLEMVTPSFPGSMYKWLPCGPLKLLIECPLQESDFQLHSISVQTTSSLYSTTFPSQSYSPIPTLINLISLVLLPMCTFKSFIWTWKIPCPPKIHIFISKCIHNRILQLDKLFFIFSLDQDVTNLKPQSYLYS